MQDRTASKTANLVMIFGIPVVIGLAGWAMFEIVSAGKTLERVLTTVEFIQKGMIRHEYRLDRLEGDYFGTHP